MYSFIILCSLLFATVSNSATEVVVDDIELSNFVEGGSSNLTLAVNRAARWLFDQRDLDKGWGPFTPRAAVALALARRAQAISVPEAEWNIVAKQLSVQLAVELGRNPGRQLSTSRLAHYINALLATCQDPRRFHGLDLVRRLRTQVDAEVRGGDLYPLPMLTLCLTGEPTRNDMNKLYEAYQKSNKKLDLQSLQLLAMSCITSQQQFSDRSIFSLCLKDFASRFHASLKHNTADVYTKALAMQALNSGDSVDVSGLSSLLSDQESDGSFERSLLATYHAVPALMGSSLLALTDTQCEAAVASQQTDLPDSQSPSKLVYVSLWVGESGEKDTHSVTVTAGRNDTLLDVMRKAQHRNHIFRFQSESTPQGVLVYSIAGIPNDSEREVKWKLHVQKRGQNQRLHEIRNRGIDQVFPSDDDNFVFWFKRDAMF